MRKAIIIFMVLLLLVAPIVRAQAVASGVTVVAAVCFAALAGWGVATIANGMTSPDLDAWMVEELGLWGTQQGSSYQSLIPESGISVNAYGDFVLDPAASLGVAQFSSWLVNKYNISSGSTANVIQGSYATVKPVVGGQLNYIGYLSTGKYVRIRPTFDCYGMIYKGGGTSRTVYYLALVSKQPFTGSVYWARYNTANTGPEYYLTYNATGRDMYGNGVYIWIDNSEYNINNVAYPVYNGDLPQAVNAWLAESPDGSLSLVGDTNISIPDENEAAQDTTISWGGSTGMTAQRAAEQIMSKVENNTLTVVIEGVAEDNPTTGWPDVDRPVGVSGLEDIFPFCIPFDVVALVQALDAEPQAPVVHWPIQVDGIIDTTIDLDFSQFDSLAQIVRTLELLAFIVGLAIATRALFIRG